jgi:hypothetical protein
MPQEPPKVAKATLKALPNGTPVPVQFNPATLVYTVENSVAQQSGGPKKVQYVAQFSGKLTMDLQFDTTDSGDDVRTKTNAIAIFMQATGNATAAAQTANPPSPNGDQGPPAKAPPVLSFQWGAYEFRGIMDSFKETIDFFSADGVALRSLVSIGLSRQDLVFDEGSKLAGTSTSGSLVPTSDSDSALSAATRGGDPTAARQLGTDNGLESLRFTGGASLEVNAGVQLNPPVAFVTAPAISGGAGFGFSVSTGAGISAGVTAGGQGSGRAPSFGASASAGVPTAAGAFAGLQVGRATVSSTGRLKPMQMLTATVSNDVATSPGASFSLGGAANSSTSSGLSTDVGARFSFKDRLIFSSDD